jgi:hypothetical protein
MLHNPMTAPTWNLQRGDILVREQTHGQYGGNPPSWNFEIELDTQRARLLGPRQSGCQRLRLRWMGRGKQVFYYTARGRGRNPWPRRHIAVREAKPSVPSI